MHAARAGLWWLLILAAVCCAVWLQLDLLSQERPALARLVPPPVQSRAVTALASRAVAEAQWSRAYDLAIQVVRHRPIPASSLSLLAFARSRGGRVADEVAVVALSEASARGWRDSFAQTGAIAMALDAERYDVAALRIDALWRTQATTAETEALLQRAFVVPQVRAQLAARAAAGVPWSAAFLGWAGANVPPDQLADFLEQASPVAAAHDCKLIAGIAARSVQAAKPRMARQLWSRFCESRSQSSETRLVEISSDGAIVGPFDWTYPADSGLVRSFDKRGVMRFRSLGLLRGALAQRWADLAPGEHSVTLVNSGRDPVLNVLCVGSGLVTRPIIVPIVYGTAQFTVVPKGCAVQLITLEVEQGEGAIADLTVR
jgi:hypothetical protein